MLHDLHTLVVHLYTPLLFHSLWPSQLDDRSGAESTTCRCPTCPTLSRDCQIQQRLSYQSKNTIPVDHAVGVTQDNAMNLGRIKLSVIRLAMNLCRNPRSGILNPLNKQALLRTPFGIWLVVSTPLKYESQLQWLFPRYGNIQNVPSHQPVGINMDEHALSIFTKRNWDNVTNMNLFQ